MRALRPTSPRTARRLATAWVVAFSAWLAGPGAAAPPPRSPSADRIRLAAGYALDPSLPEPTPASGNGTPDVVAGARALLVHYGAADPADARAAIAAAGGRIVAAIADHAFLVRVPAGRVIAPGGPLDWNAPYRPAYKLAPALARLAGASLTLNVRLFADADLAPVASAVASLGGQVLLTSDNGINRLLRVSLPRAALGALAARDEVAWIEPHRQAVPANDRVQWVVQSGVNGDRRLWDMGLHGEGQFVSITDSGIDMGHEMFIDAAQPVFAFSDQPGHRKVIHYGKGSLNPNVTFGDHFGAGFHGTHVASTIAGSVEPLGSRPYDGVARSAKIWFEDLSGPTLLNGMDPFPDLNDLFQVAWDGSGSGTPHVSCNAWGYPTDGAYTLDAMEVDQFMWGHPDFLIFFSNGDAGPAGRVGSPASAKNCVSVSATGNGLDENLYYAPSSPGPTDDGRRKPTLVAPGDGVTSADQGPAGYLTVSGTSTATAAAVGAATLVRQYCLDGWYPTRTHVPTNSFWPSAALLKAMLIASADRSLAGHLAPDDQIGYGRVNASNVCFFDGDPRHALLVDEVLGLAQGQAKEYPVTLQNGRTPLKVVLCWTDYPGDPASAVQLVNDLDLTVRRGTEVFRGNVYARGVSVTGGSADRRNVEETVRIACPGPGTWTVRVEAHAVAFGPQPFGLCVTVDDSPVTGIAAAPAPPPPALALALSGPVPAVGHSDFRLTLPTAGAVELSVYDLEGRRVRTLLDASLPAGTHPGVWDGTDASGRPVGPGVYWYRLIAGASSLARRIVLLR